MLGVVLVTLVTAISRRVGIAGPLVLVGIGLVVSILPFFDVPIVDPEIILVGILPPLLYSSAVQLPAIEFRRDFAPIAGLSVVLVVVSAVALGFVFNWVLPDLGLPLAIALGAILSPTDAVATSIVKRLGISPRVVTMLEGESLLNDATSLVILKTALAAIAGGFSFIDALGSFAWGVLIAIAVGTLVGFVNLRVRSWVAHSAANTALSFVIPFIAYLPTEALGGSGLVAAVVAGIVTGQGAARYFTPDQRISDELNWRTIELILEGAVFLIMGLELKDIVRANVEDHQGIWHAVWLAALGVVLILLMRAVYVSLLVWRQGRRAHAPRRDRLGSMGDRLDALHAAPTVDDPRRPMMSPERRTRRLGWMRTRITRAIADLDYYQASPLGWRHGTIIVWAGMRGVVTLAAAQTLPREDDPYRALLIFVAFLVAVGGLMLQGLTLPGVVRMLGLEGTGRSGPSAEEVKRLDDELRIAAAGAVNSGALTRRDGSQFSHELVQLVGARMTQPPDDDLTALARDGLELRLAVISAMRERLNAVSVDGTFSTAALRHALAELDADQLSLELRLDDED